MPLNSRQKGKRGEREFAEYLRSKGHDARRGVQYAGGPDSPDVVSALPVHFEVKFTERLLAYPFVEQALRDNATGAKKWQCVAYRANNKPWLAIVPMDDFMEVLNLCLRALDQETKPSKPGPQ